MGHGTGKEGHKTPRGLSAAWTQVTTLEGREHHDV